MDGFLEPIKSRNLSIEGDEVLLLGAGGAARAIVAGLAKEKVGKITLANRTKDKAIELKEFAQKIGIQTNVIALEDIGRSTIDFKLIVNATAIGLKNDPTPVPIETINQNTVVYDIVYMPLNTDLIKKAKEKGAAVIYGYEMLLGQAIRAFEIWHGTKAPYDVMKRAVLGGF